MITALVTGVGAAVGVSIIKALRMAAFPVRIVAVDSEPLAQGLQMADRAHLMPSCRTDPEAYLAALLAVSRKEGVQIIFSGWEGELPHFCLWKDELGDLLPIEPLPTLVALDKWLTMQALGAAGVGVPASAVPGDLGQFREKHPYPWLIKPRRGSGGRGLAIIQTDAELEFYSRHIPDPVIQELLPGEDREYTVGVMGGSLALRRTLAGGLSYRMESDLNTGACAAAERAVAALGLSGPANVQLRITPAGPKIFEINPRCSSATCVRARFGLNEPERAIRRYVLGEELAPPDVTAGICLRYWEEMYLDVGGGVQWAPGVSAARW